MKIFVIFPNHLFESSVDELQKYDKVILLEEPLNFYDAKWRPYKYNKIRLGFLRASMKYYYDFLKSKNINVEYIDYDDVKTYSFLKDKNILSITAFDTFDKDLESKFNRLKINFTFIKDTPAFLSKKEWNDYFANSKTGKHISNADYYKFLRSRLKIFEDVKSYDSENRNRFPSNLKIPNETIKFDQSKYYEEARKYIETHKRFKDNIGNIANINLYPVTHKDAKRIFSMFLKNKLYKFGEYQDAISQEYIYLYHANISAALNNGLITPDYVVKETLKYYNSNKDKITINNVEGFIRQVLGWREFMHFIYDAYYDEIIKSNHWNSTRKLNWNYWYGTKTNSSNSGLGIDTIDNEINKCVEHAYSHHIIRLMVFLNIMVLCQINPNDIKQWFMEICAIDAWDWVMVSNIWAMGHFSTRFMKKPYLATENYLLQMSDYNKKPCEIWMSLFYHFLVINNDKLKGTASIYLRNYGVFRKMTKEKQDTIMKTATNFINKVSYN